MENNSGVREMPGLPAVQVTERSLLCVAGAWVQSKQAGSELDGIITQAVSAPCLPGAPPALPNSTPPPHRIAPHSTGLCVPGAGGGAESAPARRAGGRAAGGCDRAEGFAAGWRQPVGARRPHRGERRGGPWAAGGPAGQGVPGGHPGPGQRADQGRGGGGAACAGLTRAGASANGICGWCAKVRHDAPARLFPGPAFCHPSLQRLWVCMPDNGSALCKRPPPCFSLCYNRELHKIRRPSAPSPSLYSEGR